MTLFLTEASLPLAQSAPGTLRSSSDCSPDPRLSFPAGGDLREVCEGRFLSASLAAFGGGTREVCEGRSPAPLALNPHDPGQTALSQHRSSF